MRSTAPLVAIVTSVTADGTTTAYWHFSQPVAGLANPDGLTVQGGSTPTGVVSIAGFNIAVDYAGPVNVGDDWELLAATAGITFTNGATIGDQAGNTTP